MVLLGLYVAGWGTALLRLEAAGGALWRRIEPLARRCFPIDSTARALGAGALWGWLPCGLVYSMLALALASGQRRARARWSWRPSAWARCRRCSPPAWRAARARAAPRAVGAPVGGVLIITVALAGFWRVPQLRGMVIAGWQDVR